MGDATTTCDLRKVLAVASVGCVALGGARAAERVVLSGQVVGIADGDTLTILDATRTPHRSRLDGIDAPERTQAYSQRSRQSLADLAHRREAVADCQKVDKYERKACVVRVLDVDVGLAQIQRGMAWHFKRYEAEQTPENRAAYAAAEREAREAKRGLWLDPCTHGAVGIPGNEGDRSVKPDTDSVDARRSIPVELVIAGVVATVVAAGGLYLILHKAVPIVAAPVATPEAPAKAAPPPQVAAPVAPAIRRVEAPPGPSVYRCKVNGSTTYSDAPCPGGKLIDASPAAQGFAPTPVRRAATVAQSEAEPSPASATNDKAGRDARCAWIEKTIESIDAQARQGQPAVIQDRLREDRQKLVDERYALKC